ncbi:polynucleotide phosphorylase/polyadenylase [Listeria rocourtiae FSL F6-920]|nr:polynucleotide phosphorylase/polyadenylase [Listeria rocourtiae FSL F6-920]
MTEKQVFKSTWAGKELAIEVGQMAKQANGAALIRYGDTVVLTAAVGSRKPRPGDFFPLTVNYEEKMYAVGKVPGGFLKREGRPSDRATLTARLIDRPIRPLFAEGYRNDVQITSTVLSVDQDCSPEMAAMLGSSISLCISDIPFEGPIAGVDVGRVNGEYIINPSIEQHELSDISLTVAGTKEAINMVEAGAKEVPEEAMLEAIMFGHEEIKRLIAFQEEIVAAVGKAKMEIELFVPNAELVAEVTARAEADMKTAIKTEEKLAREENINILKEAVIAEYEAKELEDAAKNFTRSKTYFRDA